jgi:hypothetical protein
MLRNVYIKLTKVNPSQGPFNIYDQWGGLIAENVSRKDLIYGVGYLIDTSITMIKLVSVGECEREKIMPINNYLPEDFFTLETTVIATGCVWRHLTNPVIYNYYYGVTKPYIIEYPFSYEYFDEIVRNVKDYSRVYRYFSLPGEATLPTNRKEIDDEWFNKAIIYNGQQCTGLLELIPKPKNNLSQYMSYPVYNDDSKTIVYTKSDSYYQYNTFWSIVKDLDNPLFVRTCESLSYDKVLNQPNMDYGLKSFTKAPIRGKEVRVRHILDNQNDIHIVSRLLIVPTQISYK